MMVSWVCAKHLNGAFEVLQEGEGGPITSL